ncbi:MAG: endonuclease/exonuclease/phosphatase family protein, partial [Caldilineaceae bacterium]|nr:endonuclease/exonuclease/phosphatase family protein [Caldilineaceae bacterium]
PTPYNTPMLTRTRRLLTPALAAWTLLWLTLGDRTGFLALLNAFTFWGLVASLPGAIISGRRPGGHWARLAALLSLFGLTTRYRRILFPTPQSPIPNPQSLRVLTFNLLKTDRDLAPVFAMLDREDPDIVCFQEVTPILAARLEAGLAERFPFRHWQPYAPTRMGLGIASRLPFAITDLFAHPGLEPFALGATVITPAGPLQIYAVQLVSPTNEVRCLGLTPLLRLRTQQARRLFAALDAAPHPALAVGDWNTTEGSDIYREAARRFTDAWTTGGQPLWRGPSAWPGTWPTTANPFADVPIPPLLRLDYCFLSRTPTLTATHIHVVRDRLGSDHCPVVVELGIGD